MSFGENLADLVAKSTNELHGKHTSWERVRLGDVAHLVNGFAFKSSAFNESEGMPIVRIRDVTSGSAGTFYRGPTDDPRMTFIEDGQIAIGMDGDFNSRLWSGGRALLNQRVCTVQADEEFYSQRLLSYALPGYLRLINEHTSAVTVKHLSSFTVRDIPLPLPPLNEQRRIVKKIDTLFAELDKGEESLRQVQTLLARYRQSVLKAAVTGELTADWRAERAGKLESSPDQLERILTARKENWQSRGRYKDPLAPDPAQLPKLPDTWTWVSLGALMTDSPQNGLYLPKSKYGSGIPILRIDDYQVDWLRPRNELRRVEANTTDREKYALRAGDFVVNRVNSVSHLGKSVLIPEDFNGVLFESNMMRFSLTSEASRSYVALYLTSQLGRGRLIQNCKHAVNQASINQGDVENTPVPLPPLKEQWAIVERVAHASAREIAGKDLCEGASKRSVALRQSILKEAFSGRLVPQDPHDEPAAELLARIHRSQEAGRAAKR